MSPEIGKLLMGLGGILLLAGLLVFLFGDKLSWLGNLPGDLRFGQGNTRVYIPLATMIILSIVLTLVINLLRKLF